MAGMVDKVIRSEAGPLYRRFLRQIRTLPDRQLREFFRIKVADDIHRTFSAHVVAPTRLSRLKRLKEELRCLERANQGHDKAFIHILDLAYGRKGPLRWSILKPLLYDPTSGRPPRIISAVERSRPPTYPPELAALVMSKFARDGGKTLTPTNLSSPPTFPPRAKPGSKEACLYGPLSKRREVNIRWRYFRSQWTRVFPPLEVTVQARSRDQEALVSGESDAVLNAGIRCIGLQGLEVVDEVEALAGPIDRRPPIPRKQRQSLITVDDSAQRTHSSSAPRKPAPTRYLRRQYRALLGRLPILRYSYQNSEEVARSSAVHPEGSYTVSLAPNALSPKLENTYGNVPNGDAVDNAWMDHAEQTSTAVNQRKTR